MAWIKGGHIFSPNGRHDWNRSHAQVPVVDTGYGDRWRVYYASRDGDNRSRTSFIEVEAGRPEHVLYEHEAPVLPLGPIGTCDDAGIMPTWVLTVGETKYLYYIGWTQRVSVPYQNAVHLALSVDGGRTFEKYGNGGPLLPPTPFEPYFTGTCCVMNSDGVWRMWYLSCTKWEMIEGKAEPFYHLKYAESGDGIQWKREGVVAVDYKSETEGGVVSASVVKDAGRYRMWYGYREGKDYRTNRSKSYRIGCAESTDGVKWDRRDEEAGIDVSPSGWDSQMISYPYVFRWGDKLWMFYNGNGFGASGFGYATRDLSELERAR